MTESTAIEKAFPQDKVELIKRTVAKGASNDELEIFLHQCKKTGLDPLAKQIYFQKRLNKKTGESTMTIITGIDGYRLVAHRTGVYAGMDSTVFDNETNPRRATVTVYKLVGGVRCPFSATARWDQYYPGDQMGFMWKKMPHLMLEKCAEALALRKAFPAELSGVYTSEEMEQADAEVVTVHSKPEPSQPKPQAIGPMAEAVSSVIEAIAPDLPPAERIIRYGQKYSGHKFGEFHPEQIQKYVNWMRENGKDQFDSGKQFIADAEDYIASVELTETKKEEDTIPF